MRKATDTLAAGQAHDVAIDRPRCAQCGEIIGVYEPMRLLLANHPDQRGSPLTLGEQLPGATAVHEKCYEAFQHNRQAGHAEPEA